MKCPFCQNEMGGIQTGCPHCKRPHSPQVAYYIEQGWNSLQGGAWQEARQVFAQALQATPASDKKQLESYIFHLLQATEVATTDRAAEVTTTSAQPRSPTVSAPAPRPQAGQSSKGAARGLFFNFNEKPANIVRVMDEARRRQDEFTKAHTQRMKIIALLLPAGLPFVLLDWVIGYNFLTFSLVAYVLWLAALVSLILLRRNQPSGTEQEPGSRPKSSIAEQIFAIVFFVIFCGGFAITFLGGFAIALANILSPFLLVAIVLGIVIVLGFFQLWRSRPGGTEFGPQFDVARTIFETLKDDVAPKRTFIGWLDLTGTRQDSKIVRKRTSSSGMPIAFFRDEWLRMKMRLYDGNVMRVSVIERVKAKLGRWKRGRVSGKRKWKPGRTVWTRKELRVAITVNREAYEVQPIQSGQVGKFSVEAGQSDEGRIVLEATSNHTVSAGDILQVLRFAYDHLKPRGTSAM